MTKILSVRSITRRDKKHIEKVKIKFLTQPSQSDCDLPAYIRDLGHCSACCNLSIKSFLFSGHEFKDGTLQQCIPRHMIKKKIVLVLWRNLCIQEKCVLVLVCDRNYSCSRL